MKCPKTTMAICNEMCDFKNHNKEQKIDVDCIHSDHSSNYFHGGGGEVDDMVV